MSHVLTIDEVQFRQMGLIGQDQTVGSYKVIVKWVRLTPRPSSQGYRRTAPRRRISSTIALLGRRRRRR